MNFLHYTDVLTHNHIHSLTPGEYYHIIIIIHHKDTKTGKLSLSASYCHGDNINNIIGASLSEPYTVDAI